MTAFQKTALRLSLNLRTMPTRKGEEQRAERPQDPKAGLLRRLQPPQLCLAHTRPPMAPARRPLGSRRRGATGGDTGTEGRIKGRAGAREELRLGLLRARPWLSPSRPALGGRPLEVSFCRGGPGSEERLSKVTSHPPCAAGGESAGSPGKLCGGESRVLGERDPCGCWLWPVWLRGPGTGRALAPG